MKRFLTALLLIFSVSFFAQDYNLKNGYVADGYDVVAYFTAKKPLEGNKKFKTTYEGVKFKFVSAENLNLFKANPTKYIPQYGGYCAYAIGAKNRKKKTDPTSFEIRDGKLYLFYSSFFGNMLDEWKEGNTKELQTKADKNWQKLKFKN